MIFGWEKFVEFTHNHQISQYFTPPLSCDNNFILSSSQAVCVTDGLDAAAHSAVEKRARYRQRSNSVGKRRSRAGSFKKIREELESEVCILCMYVCMYLCVCVCV